jgi:DNA polymerase-1
MPQQQVRQPVILVDASSYLFRAFHAMPMFTNSKGQHTGAIHGVINMVRKMLKDYEPTHLAMVFDAKGKTFRDDLYPEYKANRPPMPDELRQQVDILHDIIRAMGIPLVMEEGVEADDVIGTLARRFADDGLQVLISTGDKDMAQLVDDHISLINTMTNDVLTPDTVKAKFGVAPEQIIDYLALIGDKVDNVPGIPKVGPKTAVKWLQTYGSLDAIAEHAGDIGGKVGESLREHLAQLPLSRDLVTIRQRLPLTETLEDLRLKEPDREALTHWFRELEFKSQLQELLRQGPSASDTREDPPAEDIDREAYELVATEEQLQVWCDKVRRSRLVAVDTETTALDAMEARVVGVSLAVAPGEACYVPFGHKGLDAGPQLEDAVAWRHLMPILESADIAKVGQNLKYDIQVLANEGVALKGIAHDTMLESYVLDAAASRHDLDSLSLKYLGHACLSYEEVAGKGKQQLNFSEVDVETATRYAAEDADVTLRLHKVLWPRLEEDDALRSVYETLELPLVPVLARMERRGVLIDGSLLAKQSQALGERLQALEKQAYDLAGEAFNLGSPKQLQAILFEKLGLPVKKKTPKGQPSTNEEVLQELALDYPLPKVILEYRSLAKLKSTYTDKLPKQINPRTGRVHTSYHQAVTATGRLSSSDPNLQNIPVRSEEGRAIRKAFVAPEGHCIIAADYSQIELRIMAHLSGDSGLQKAFAQGQDIHKATAAEVFGVALSDVTAEQRRRAKAINFGLIYGMSAFGLAKQLGIPRDEAQHYIHTYFARYPGVEAYMEATRRKAHEQGYVETLFGRRLYLPDIHSRNGMRRQAAERAAINAPMQGTAADIIKRAMIDIDRWIAGDNQPLAMVMQVHDELVFEAPKDQAGTLAKEIASRMSQAADLSVPLVVDTGIGDNWEEAH